MTPARRVPALARPVFVLYWAAMAIATHWPGVTIEGPVERPDVWVHIGAYALWTALLVATAWLGPPTARTAILALGAGVAWGALDELTQPIFDRQADWADFAGDALGSLLGAVGAALALHRLTRRQ